MGSHIKCAAELHKATTVWMRQKVFGDKSHLRKRGSFFLLKADEFHLFPTKMFTIQFFFLLNLN